MNNRFSVNAVLLFFLAFPLAVLSGCVTLPSPEQIKAEISGYQLPKLPEAGKAIVYVVRPSPLGTAIRFNVFVDNQNPESEMGYTRGSQYIYFNLTPGNHKIFSKAENWAEIDVSAKAGDIIFIQQNTEMGIIMARNSVVTLQDYEGKYHVKTLSLGTIIKTNK